MKTKSKFLLPILLFSLIALPSLSQPIFNLTGEFRPRIEFRHGYKSLADSGADAGLFVTQRTRLNLSYTTTKIKSYLSFQDIRTWGSTSQQNTADGFLSVHEVWVEYFFCKNFSMRSGRQELDYDDARILGNADWGQAARSHDIALFKWKPDSLTMIHAGFAFNQNMEQFNTNYYSVPGNYKSMQYLWLNRKFKKLNVSVLVLNNGIQSPANKNYSRYSQTAGTHTEYKNGSFAAMLNVFYQTGEDAVKKNLAAYLCGGEISYTVKKQMLLLAGVEMQSGQSQTDTSNAYTKVDHVFTPLYGTNHKFNGYMDYFYAGNSHGNVGLQDIYGKIRFTLNKFSVQADIHLFSSAANVLDKTNFIESGEYKSLNSSLGMEPDLTVKYKLSDIATVQLGYAIMLATSTMEAIKTGDKNENNQWAYLQITFKPTFMKN